MKYKSPWKTFSSYRQILVMLMSVEKKIKWPKPEEKKEEEKARGLANKSQTCVRGGGGNEGLRPQHVPDGWKKTLSIKNITPASEANITTKQYQPEFEDQVLDVG
ncbi:hypothetical protein J6590_073310 [Homalodisca vitripennis]|nr:hypothetical protein J6590_073310 [Homalodisca vitripennis]